MAGLNYECPRCRGTGIGRIVAGPNTIGEEDPCSKCGGDGLVTVADVDVSDLADKVDDVLDKCNDILEKLNE